MKPESFNPAASKTLLIEQTSLLSWLTIKKVLFNKTEMEFFINSLRNHFNPCGAQQMLSAGLEKRASMLIV